MQQVEFDSAFIFKYSQRKGTIAERKFPDNVLERTKTERIVRLNALQKEITLKKNRSHIGEVQEVLVESESESDSPGTYFGRNDGNTSVIFPGGPFAPGGLIKVRITDASPNNLKGEIA
jgi:tRNA-2-methylthio-N6-dimethylallyladenosine synthase